MPKISGTPTNEDLFNFKCEVKEELADFKKDIGEKFIDFKKDICDKFTAYEKVSTATINAKGTILKVMGWVVGLLLVAILIGIYRVSTQVATIKVEQVYTKRVAEKTAMKAHLTELKQLLINATLIKKDTSEIRKLSNDVEIYKEKIKKYGFIVIDTERGIVIADENESDK
jgi:hypothetical protein